MRSVEDEPPTFQKALTAFLQIQVNQRNQVIYQEADLARKTDPVYASYLTELVSLLQTAATK